MSLNEFFHNARETEVDLAWCHWNRLGVAGRGKVNSCSTDPEALILLTSIVGRHDLRLSAVMDEWLGCYESLVSVERLKRYIKGLQADAGASNDHFVILHDALSRLDAKRWQPIFNLIADKRSTNISENNRTPSRKKLEQHDHIIRENRQLFLRLMFGVGSRADIIYYAGVIENQEKNPFGLRICAPHLTRMLHYNNSSVFRTLLDLEEAGVFVADPRAQSKKSKTYAPNARLEESRHLFSPVEHNDRAFIDWLPIVRICLLLASLEKGLDEAIDESIVKSRLKDYLTACARSIDDACIDLKDSLGIEAHFPALISVGFDELQGWALAQLEGIYEFVAG